MKQNLNLRSLIIALIVTDLDVMISYTQRINQPLPSKINRLSEAKIIEIKNDAGLVVLSGSFTTISDTQRELERTAPLMGGPLTIAMGKAVIKLVKSGDTFLKQELEVAVEGLAKRAKFKLFVDKAEVIVFTTSKSGKAVLKFSSKNAKK